MTEADYEKVVKFKREFEPNSLPDEVLQSGLYIAGSESMMNIGYHRGPPHHDGRGINPSMHQIAPPYGG
jgi:hypothetical protein